MTLRAAAKSLLVASLALPVVQAVLTWVIGLLTAMGDGAGAGVVRHVGTACQIAWTISLAGLVLVLAFIVLNDRPTEEED
jgi:hypothetical protein